MHDCASVLDSVIAKKTSCLHNFPLVHSDIAIHSLERFLHLFHIFCFA